MHDRAEKRMGVLFLGILIIIALIPIAGTFFPECSQPQAVR